MTIKPLNGTLVMEVAHSQSFPFPNEDSVSDPHSTAF